MCPLFIYFGHVVYSVRNISQSMYKYFQSIKLQMWKLDCKEGWAPKNSYFWTVVLEKSLESPLDCKEIQQSIVKEISPGISLERMMLKLKLQYFGHLMWRIDSLEKTLMLGGLGAGGEGDDRDEMAGTPGVGDGQGGLVCCDSWGHKESDMTERLNWIEKDRKVFWHRH